MHEASLDRKTVVPLALESIGIDVKCILFFESTSRHTVPSRFSGLVFWQVSPESNEEAATPESNEEAASPESNEEAASTESNEDSAAPETNEEGQGMW